MVTLTEKSEAFNMRESLFVKQNTQKWKDYENHKNIGPDELAESFISITDDLAYAKTFYPESNTTKYLNGLAASFHQSIYKNKKEKTSRFIAFWRFELPLTFYKHRKPLLYSFLFFMAFSLMGALSAKYDPKFLRLILGNDYVNMTNDNIKKGDPFGVYKSQGSFLMFLQIAFNNIRVELYTFVMGILFSIGSIYQLLMNGIMLGSFEYYFFSLGFGMQSVLVIWIHGTLEISAIIVAGGAGLTLGNGLLFPKTFNRMVSIKNAAKDGLKIAIGLIPIFLVAAFFESFVTRHTEMPVLISLSILLSSLAFIIWYVIIYPALLNRKFNHNNFTFNEKAF